MNVSNAAAIINIDISDFGHLARAQVCALPIRQKRIDIYCENTRGCTDDRGSGGGGYLRQHTNIIQSMMRQLVTPFLLPLMTV